MKKKKGGGGLGSKRKEEKSTEGKGLKGKGRCLSFFILMWPLVFYAHRGWRFEKGAAENKIRKADGIKRVYEDRESRLKPFGFCTFSQIIYYLNNLEYAPLSW